MESRLNEKDPRVIRTRNLIQEAFNELSGEKDFESITVLDITKRATVNRATFYAHFEDKYELLEQMVSKTFLGFAEKRIPPQAALSEETMRNLILALCDYHESLSDRCKRNYQSISVLVETKLRLLLQDIIYTLLLNSKFHTESVKKSLELASVMISCTLYGAAYHWYTKGRQISASDFVIEILPFVMAGMEAIAPIPDKKRHL